MLVIGLTGPTGAGKGQVAKLFAQFGLPCIDADRIYHDLLLPPSPCLDELVDHFGASILAENGELDRRALGQIVFYDPDELSVLNEIAHRYVMAEIRRRLEQLRRDNTRATVIDAPQLFEAGADKDCNVILSVLADPKVRIDRIVHRDGIDQSAAEARMAVQKPDIFFRANSDYVIENNDTPEALLPKIRQILFEMGVLP